jgi:2-enoate reductase
VTILTNTTIKSFTDEGVFVSSGADKMHTIQADTVILSFGTKPDNKIAKSIYENYQYVQIIGDANAVGRIGDAVRQGFFSGYAI